jgi:hypothetical protein
MALAPRDDRPCLAMPPAVGLADPIALCERARDLLEREPATELVCDVGEIGRPDLGTVEVLARVRLTAARLGSGVRLRHASGELVDLLSLIGLRSELPLEVEGQAEEREEASGVEEEGDAGDLAT